MEKPAAALQKQPIPGEPVILSITKEVLTYVLIKLRPRSITLARIVQQVELAAAPVLSHIKTLMTSMAVNVNAVTGE